MIESTDFVLLKAFFGDIPFWVDSPNAAIAIGIGAAIFFILMGTFLKRPKPPQVASGFPENQDQKSAKQMKGTRAMPDVLAYDASGASVSLKDVRNAAAQPPQPIRIVKQDDQWPDPTQEEIDAFFEEHAVSSIYLVRQWPNEDEAPTSYLGGFPTLPESISWPRNRRTGLPLHFLAQINFDEMPELFDGPEFPEEGTLFFFGDISEQMHWKDTCAMQEDTRVLYTDEDIRDLKETMPPSDLPDIGHEDDKASGGFAEKDKKSFVKWPVKGHVVDTIPSDWSRSREQVSPKLISGAQDLAARQITALIVDAPESPGAKSLIKITKASANARRPLLGEETDEEIEFVPEGLGGQFPYNGKVAKIVLRTFLTEAESKYESLMLRRDSYSKGKRGKKTPELAYLEGYMPTTRGLLNGLKAIDVYDALPPKLMEAFELWLQVEVKSGFIDGWTMTERLHIALRHAARLAVSDEKLRASLPDGFMDHFRRDLQPSINDGEHMIGGPKSFKTAPTSGEGVKLLQLDSDYAVDFMFSDYGIADFWIEEEDLEALRFENAYGATASA
ncbi:DUF1963 domain-containing protein [Parasulfitobacter algicola]|uniref:DUF1963 domain-containing protein n=1 Tax=Parasulfitobacter algicola TaxID=2614809 RepID=A0ABX2IRR1_9RHOB|nr:DUF1963 domain-containing protein [Sulfitobacter algicola]NSX55215.1 DUF1963 domain-containing protein [Sulfitobacter algicola]